MENQKLAHVSIHQLELLTRQAQQLHVSRHPYPCDPLYVIVSIFDSIHLKVPPVFVSTVLISQNHRWFFLFLPRKSRLQTPPLLATATG